MNLRVSFDEMIGVREVARHLPILLARLERKEVPHFILTRRSTPCAVLLTIDRYEELLKNSSKAR